MKKTVILSSFFIGLSIVFSGSLISYNLRTVGSNFLILIIFFSGVALLFTIVLMYKELLPNDLFANKNHLSENEKKLLKDNDIDAF